MLDVLNAKLIEYLSSNKPKEVQIELSIDQDPDMPISILIYITPEIGDTTCWLIENSTELTSK